ncbi:LysM peptidoglycan-binding domain-containing protein [Reichenbachiella agarivorans]|uniref:LysM peptidoglycan-binding domain-containing protein n=1 Tax=Reichenbachiella agarivorans TaxID=2979464 RepID=A0ABY6CL65_9BACT|nr:LysM peptidoglycan-binding domain-containing protein [Reichenbachiella agarivorans]UXP31256.1 LysM peptidoglycan-binding domain-containing protein [Reichenbachiella agarivorans]
MRYLIACWALLWGLNASAEDLISPNVPSSMEFAGMKLKITESARRDIQKDVDMLTQSEKYFEIKADRARLYFPIIEETLRKENVPEDFKYLSIQESALISDAVSSSNAVGFWQFKDFTGREVGLRIDRDVDERLNIVASTIGAAKYFKRHNFYFNNWIYTLLAHMTGRGGAAKYVDQSQFGANKMTIDRDTHWYVKRCLAHKIAFGSVMEKKHSEGMRLMQYDRGAGMSLSKIANELNVDETELRQYNKWLKSGKVPGEKTYIVIVPIRGKMKPIEKIGGGVDDSMIVKSGSDKDSGREQTSFEKVFPSLSKTLNTDKSIFVKINGLPTILAKSGDNVTSVASKVNLDPARFAKYNDLKVTDRLTEGEIYYLRSKRNRGLTYYYTAQRGETLWEVSQKFGIKLKQLAKLNRMSVTDRLQPGRVMWLRQRRPSDVPVEIRELPAAPVDETIPVKELKQVEEPKPAQSPVQLQEVSESAVDEVVIQKPAQTEKEELPVFMEMEDSPELIDEKPRVVKEEKASYFTHTVNKGETLYSISKKYGVSVEDIKEWNDMQSGGLSIGQSLVIHGEGRPFELAPAQVDFHVVGPGDTMYSISKKYGISIDKLLTINQKDNFALSIGERIRVKE